MLLQLLGLCIVTISGKSIRQRSHCINHVPVVGRYMNFNTISLTILMENYSRDGTSLAGTISLTVENPKVRKLNEGKWQCPGGIMVYRAYYYCDLNSARDKSVSYYYFSI